MATEVEAFQISQRQCLRPSRLTANMVDAQVSDKQHDTIDLSISKILSEIKKDQEEQRHLMEDLTKKIEHPARKVFPGMKHISSWGPRNVSGGNCWNCEHFSLFLPQLQSWHTQLWKRRRDQTKGPRFGPALLSTAPVFNGWDSAWK